MSESFASIDAALDWKDAQATAAATPPSDQPVNDVTAEPAEAAPQPDAPQEAPGTEQAVPDAQSEPTPSEYPSEQADAGEPAPQAEGAEAPVPTEIDWAMKVPVKDADGEREVTLEELRRQHMWQADYTRKTQELAKQRQEFEKEAQTISSEREQYVQGLQQISQALALQAPPEPDRALEEIDPVTYLQQVTARQQFEQRMNGLQQEQHNAMQQQAAEQQAQVQAYVQQSKEQLLAARPELQDPASMREFADKNRRYLLDSGFTDEEASNVTDWRAALAIDKARRFDEMQKQANSKKAQATQSPTGTIQQSRTASPPPGPVSAVKKAEDRFKASGSLDDAVDMLLAKEEAAAQ